MRKVTSLLPDRFKRSLKYYVEELRDRNDYEVKVSKGKCNTCGGEAQILQFRFFDQKGWKSVYEGQDLECKGCRDYKEVKKVLENQRVEARQRVISCLEEDYWYIQDDLKSAGFKNFNVEGNSVLKAKRDAMDYVKEFTEMPPGDRYNLLIMGNPGVGKTHLATAIARTLKEKGFLVGQLTTGTLLAKIKSTYKNNSDKTERGILEDLEKFDLLILDDLGSEARNKDEFGWSKNMLFEIVNLRMGKPTIYTSNFSEQHLPTAIGERVCSRLCNNTKFVEIVTEDYRRNYLIQ